MIYKVNIFHQLLQQLELLVLVLVLLWWTCNMSKLINRAWSRAELVQCYLRGAAVLEK